MIDLTSFILILILFTTYYYANKFSNKLDNFEEKLTNIHSQLTSLEKIEEDINSIKVDTQYGSHNNKMLNDIWKTHSDEGHEERLMELELNRLNK